MTLKWSCIISIDKRKISLFTIVTFYCGTMAWRYSGPALRVGNGCHGIRPTIFGGQNILLYLLTIIENKKLIIFKERKYD
jgi:hypothetical protein